MKLGLQLLLMIITNGYFKKKIYILSVYLKHFVILIISVWVFMVGIIFLFFLKPYPPNFISEKKNSEDNSTWIEKSKIILKNVKDAFFIKGYIKFISI